MTSRRGAAGLSAEMNFDAHRIPAASERSLREARIARSQLAKVQRTADASISRISIEHQLNALTRTVSRDSSRAIIR